MMKNCVNNWEYMWLTLRLWAILRILLDTFWKQTVKELFSRLSVWKCSFGGWQCCEKSSREAHFTGTCHEHHLRK